MTSPLLDAGLRIGIVGFDTSHVAAFTRLLNDASHPFRVPGGRVVAGFPSSSPDVPLSHSRVESIVQEMTGELAVPLVASVEELIERVDVVLLESGDGRRHLPESLPILRANKPLFIDKPLAASYADAAAIVRQAQERGCPLFSASSLRFDAHFEALGRDPSLGEVLACDAFCPGPREPTNPGLFWYGVHGVEMLYRFLGPGCARVRCLHFPDHDVVVARWNDGRLASLRASRCGPHDYGVTLVGTNRVAQAVYSREVPLYSQLLRQVMRFFQTGTAPVAPEETLETMAFLQAALWSEEQNREVELQEVTTSLAR